MAMELTDKILRGLKGRLDITVAHPGIEGDLRVVGISSSAIDFGWHNMPDSFRVPNRDVYCCEAAGKADPVFVFADEVTVTDAPAHLVVGAMLDMIADIDSENALTPYDVIDILEGRSISPDEWDEEEG